MSLTAPLHPAMTRSGMVLRLLLLISALPAAAADPESEAGIVEEAWAVERDPVLRPTHVDPALPGTFEDGLAPWAEALNDSHARLEGQDAARRLAEFFDGAGPLPEIWRAELGRSSPLLDGALAATHRAGARLPPGGRLQSVFTNPRPSTLEFHHLWRLALLDASLASERGDHALALRRCADVLALSRDLSNGYLVMAMVGAGMVPRSTRVCLQLAHQAPVAQRRRFLTAVERIRNGWGRPSMVFRQERLFGQLLFATRFDNEQRAVLPPALESVVKGGPDIAGMGGLRAWLFGGIARRAIFQQMTLLVSLSDRSPEEADPLIEELDTKIPTSVRLAGIGMDGPPTSWLKYLRRLRAASAQVTLLQATLAADLFQSQHGTLPRTWSAVLPSGAPIDPRTGRALALDLRPDAPGVRAEADPSRDAEELFLPLRRPLPPP